MSGSAAQMSWPDNTGAVALIEGEQHEGKQHALDSGGARGPGNMQAAAAGRARLGSPAQHLQARCGLPTHLLGLHVSWPTIAKTAP